MSYEFIDFKALKQFCEVVFKPLFNSPCEGECAELIYDDSNNLNYHNAYHVAIKDNTFENFVKTIADISQQLMLINSNVSIFPASVQSIDKPQGVAKRSKKSDACRAAAWIIEVEPPKEKKIELSNKGLLPLNPENRECLKVIRELLSEAAISLPKVIREAVRLIYVTGGGLNLVVQFSEPTKNIERASQLFRKIVLEAKAKNPKVQIDESSGNIFHAQRLVGTLNWKYGGFPVRILPRDRFWLVDGKSIPFNPFNVDDMFIDYGLEHKAKNSSVARNKYLETKSRIGQYKKEISRDVIDEILRRVDFPTVFSDKLEVVRETPNYYLCRCPFHKPDNDPSFCVYKNLDSDGIQIGVDFHDDSSYDAIAFARHAYNIHDFRSALVFLAERVGMDLSELEIVGKERKKVLKQKAKQEAEKGDLEAAFEEEGDIVQNWIKQAGINPTSVRIEYSDDFNKIVFSFEVDSPFAGKVRLKYTANELLNPDAFLNKLIIATVKEIEFPVEKKKEIKQFLRKLYTEFVFLANQNKAIESSFSIKENIGIQLIRYVERYYKNFIEYYAIFQNPEIFAFYFDERNKLLHTTIFAFTKFLSAAIHNFNISTNDVIEAINKSTFAKVIYEQYDGNRFPFIVIDGKKFAKILLVKYRKELSDPDVNAMYKETLKEDILLNYGELADPEFWAEELNMDIEKVIELCYEARQRRLERNTAAVAFGAIMKETSTQMQEIANSLDKVKDKIEKHKIEFVNSSQEIETPKELLKDKKKGEPIANNENATYFKGARISSSELTRIVEKAVDSISKEAILRDKELMSDIGQIRNNLDKIKRLEEEKLRRLQELSQKQQNQSEQVKEMLTPQSEPQQEPSQEPSQEPPQELQSRPSQEVPTHESDEDVFGLDPDELRDFYEIAEEFGFGDKNKEES